MAALRHSVLHWRQTTYTLEEARVWAKYFTDVRLEVSYITYQLLWWLFSLLLCYAILSDCTAICHPLYVLFCGRTREGVYRLKT